MEGGWSLQGIADEIATTIFSNENVCKHPIYPWIMGLNSQKVNCRNDNSNNKTTLNVQTCTIDRLRGRN